MQCKGMSSVVVSDIYIYSVNIYSETFIHSVEEMFRWWRCCGGGLSVTERSLGVCTMLLDASDVSSVSVSLIVFVNAISEIIQCDCRSGVVMAQRVFPFRDGRSVTERSLETCMRCWEILSDDAFSFGEFDSFCFSFQKLFIVNVVVAFEC